MKRMKRFASWIMAFAMALTLVVPAVAAETTYTITINNSDPGHIYEAYQIFSGELHGDDVLSNIAWGTGISEAGQTALEDRAEVEDAAGVAEKLDAETDAKKFAEAVSSYLAEVASTSTAGEGIYTISDLAPGYYLIKDKDNSLEGKDTTYTEYMIKIVKDISVNPKDSEASLVKKVEDHNDSSNKTSDWQDSADYDIGDAVPFRIVATLPANVTSFETYEVRITDTLSPGLSYTDASNLKVFVNDVDKTTDFTITDQVNDDGTTTLVIRCNDVKSLGATNNSEIRVNYDAVLNNKAVIGSAGNPNEAYLEYSNNPNDSGLGKTKEDKVIVFTYKVVINKVTEDGKPLPGAKFELKKKIAKSEPVVIDVVEAGNGTIFSFEGLDDGDYILTEIETPEGFNDIDPIEFTITAEHDIEAVEPQLLTLTGGNLLTGEVSTGTLTGNVINESGATLPETGGMGTTLFYALGGVLVIGAGVALVTKKRMA